LISKEGSQDGLEKVCFRSYALGAAGREILVLCWFQELSDLKKIQTNEKTESKRCFRMYFMVLSRQQTETLY